MGNIVSNIINDEFTREKLKQERLKTQQLELQLAETKQQETHTKIINEQIERNNKQTEYILRSASLVAGGIVIGLGLGIVGLAADYAYNGSRRVIRWRVRRALTYYKTISNVKSVPLNLLRSTNKYKLHPELLPVVLVGPSGCGKSTLLSVIAQECVAAKVPMLYLSIRAFVGTDIDYLPNDQINAVKRMNSIIGRLLTEIGYPICDPLILQFLRNINFISYGQGIKQAKLPVENDISSRFEEALTLLLDVYKEVRDERKAKGYSLEKSAPVLLLDEVHDLI